MKISKFRINRKTWMRGEEEAVLLRRNDDNSEKMCCLGFYACAKGINKQYLLEISSPMDLIKKDSEFMIPELVSGDMDSILCNNLMITNDDKSIEDDERENKIKKEFAKLNVEVEFYN